MRLFALIFSLRMRKTKKKVIYPKIVSHLLCSIEAVLKQLFYNNIPPMNINALGS